ncbi:hypothetical protein RB608_09275 [Nocardioides sp. LHD-245]|uniref:hypothetical protein n=1 Tax=Nocardioides sp. LHD-245 TaxID=3051387 RepID=UPI0027E06ECE|nr:hypothetical protein [Nocardioides sp. LHD-245]
MEDGLTLDAGALIAVERGDRVIAETIRQALLADRPVHVVPGALAQAWRDGQRQVRLARLLKQEGVVVVGFAESTARLVGELAGVTGHADVTDVHVALHARQHRHAVVTSDPDDIRAVDPSLPVIEV